ncbi:MAG TPA: hypothetical protein VHY18_11045 [Solirubrobacteraceae bacterium]|nr:hypothetical protein [Solirubrobacteraceae bacterium]
MTLLATTLPEHSNDGYVAAAYIVFFAIVLIYLAIMAVRLGRVERKVEALRGDGGKNGMPPARAGGAAVLEDPDQTPERSDRGQERTLKGAGETV